MAGRQVNGGTVTIGTKFTSDISGLQQAKSALEDIQKKSFLELKIVDYSSAKGVEEATRKLDIAKESASKLSSMLDAAFNKDLGKLNISAFEQQLKKSSVSLQQMYADLSALGPVGQDAFHKVATEVLTTSTQLQKSKTFLDDMAETMSNTIKWGIASSAMKNFTTSVQQAYNYVKDLDHSLNEIRIVSGLSADQMDRFAIKANASAKALGAATKQYTDASLIYFQQGLGMEEATQRTDVTIKMSNVLGESASKVSDYMTAIWNNFDDGSQSLEYFGDVLAKLGASTASSAEEIAEGLDKFAAVSNTVGLSYEYATTALATVVAETRQSADVVGTAFKTLFARIQDLELGKTLDDDTTLGTYSQALEAVGINIKQQNGELKDMDDILNEMGTKWKTLGKDQQVALAQTVAGVRQYTQLIALMDNWDTFNKNLKIAQTSAGTLEEQQSIYMESVDAHVQQLKTSWEELYSAIGDTKTINGVLDTLTGAVNLLDNFVDSVGGGSGALLLLGSVGLKVFDKQLSGGVTRLIRNFNQAKNATKELEAQTAVFNEFKMIDDGSDEYKNLLSMVEQRLEYQDLMTDKELEDINNIIKAKAEQDRLLKSVEETAKAAEKFYEISSGKAKLGSPYGINAEKGRLLGRIENAEFNLPNAEEGEDKESIIEAVTKVNQKFEVNRDYKISEDNSARDAMQRFWESYGNEQNASEKLLPLKRALGENSEEFQNLSDLIDRARKSLEEFVKNDSIDQNAADVKKYEAAWNDVVEAVQQLENNIGDAKAIVNESSEAAVKNLSNIERKVKDIAASSSQKLGGEYGTFIDEKKTQRGVQGVSDLASATMSYAMAIESIQNLGSIWNNEDLSTGEKLLQIVMSLSMAFGGLAQSIPLMQKAFSQIKTSNIWSSLNKDIHPFEKTKKKRYIKEYSDKFAGQDIGKLDETKYSQQYQELDKINEYNKAQAELVKARNVFKSDKSSENAFQVVSAQDNIQRVEEEINANEELAKSQKILQGLKEKNVELDKLSSSQKISLINVSKAENLTDNEKTVLQKAIISGDYKEVSAETLEKASKEGIITAQETENAVKTQGIAVNKAYRVSLSLLMTAGMAAIAAIGFAIGQYNNHKEKEAEATKANNDAIIEEEKARREEISSIKDAAAAYIELEKTQGSMTQEEYISKKNELINTLGSEKEHLEDLIETYGSYDEALNKFKAEKAKEEADSAQKEYEATQSNVNTVTHTGKFNLGQTILNQMEVIGADLGTLGINAFNPKKVEEHYQNMPEWEKWERDIDKANRGIDIDNTYTLADFQRMSAAQRNVLAGGQDNYQKLLEAGQAADASRIESMALDLGALDVTSKEEAQKVYQSIIDNFNASFDEEGKSQDFAETQESARELLDNYLSSVDNSFMQAIQYQESERDSTLEEVRNNVGKARYTDENGKEYSLAWALGAGAETNPEATEKFNEVYNQIAGNSKWQQLIGLSGDNGLIIDWAKILNIKDAEERTKYLQDLFEKNQEAIKNNFQLTQGKELTGAANSAYVSSFDEDYSMVNAESDKNLQTLLNNKDEYLAIYPEMTNQFKILEQTQLAGTQEYQKALSDLADFQEQAYIQSKINAVDQAEEELAQLKKTNKASEKDITKIQNKIKAAKKDLNLALNSGMTDFRGQIKQVSKDMESLQTSYKTITTVAQDYNDDGKLTLDNLQSLLDMNWEYLSILRIQDGQMTINKDAAKAMLKIKLDEARQKIWEYTLNRIIAASENEVQTQANATSQANAALGGSINQVTEAARTGTDALLGFAEAAAKARGVTLNTKNQDVLNALEDARTLFAAVDATENADIDTALTGGAGGTQADKKEYEVDKYEKINRIIEKLTRNIQKLQDAQNKLVGADLLSNLNQQTEVLEEQNKAYEKKLELQKEEAANLRNQLSEWGATFDQDNNINYNAFMVDITNAANAGSISDDQYERYKEAADKYKQVWESDIHDVEDSIQETASKLAEIELEKLNVKVNMQLDTSDATRQYNEWYNKVVQKATRAFGSITNVLTGELAKKNVQTYMDDTVAWINKFTETKSLYDRLAQGDTSVDQSKLLDDLKEASQGLMSAIESIEDEYKNVMDAYLSSIDSWSDALDKINSDYESINSQLNHAVSLTKLLFGDDSYSTQNQYLSKVIANSQQQLTFAQQQVTKFQKKMNQALAKNDDELYEKYKEKYTSWLSSINSILESTLQNIQTKYTNSLSQIFTDFEKKILGTSLDKSNEEWDRLKTSAGLYLDKVNRAYEITKLQAKYTKQLNSTSNIDIQNKINKAMQAQVKALQAKTKLSKYDVDLANAKYETLVAEIALQEAQANKTKMQLQRDSQGNYSYVYSQDENAIADAQSKLEEARVNEWNIIKEKNDSIVSDFSTQMKNFEDALKKAYMDNKDDPKTRETEIKKIISEFKPIFGGLGNQWSTARDDMAEWIASDKGISVTSVTDDMIKGYYPNWNNNMVDMLTKLGNSNSFEEMANQIAKEANEKTAEYQTQVNEILNTTKTSLADIKNGIYGEGGDSELSSIKDKDERIAKAAETNMNKLEALKNTVTEKYNDFMNKYGNLAKGYLKQSQEWLKKINDATQKYQKSIDKNVSSIKSAMSDVTNAIENSRVTEEDIKKAVSDALAGYTGSNYSDSADNGIMTTKPDGMPTSDWEAYKKKNKILNKYPSGMPSDVFEKEGYKFETTNDNSSQSSHVNYEGSSAGMPQEARLFANGFKQDLVTGKWIKKIGEYSNKDIFGKTIKYLYYQGPNGQLYYRDSKDLILKQVSLMKDLPYIDKMGAFLSNTYRSSYDTGGYTGDWSGSTGEYKNGRWALLHPKELVLNRDDTKNFLTAIEGVRSMSDIISMLDSYSNARYSMIADNIKSPNINTTNTDNSSSVTQNIAINADFSGLHDAQELENAIDNLSNKALQYAYKTI